MVNTGQCPACYATNSFSATHCLDCKKPLPWASSVAAMQKQIEAANQAVAQVQAQAWAQAQAQAQISPQNNSAGVVAPSAPLSVSVYRVFGDAFVGRPAEALQNLDKSGALLFGLFCAVAANVCMAIGLAMIMRQVSTFLQAFMPFGLPGAMSNPLQVPGLNGGTPAPTTPDLATLLRLGIVAFVPWLSIVLCCTGARMLFRGQERHFEGDVFVAGVTLLPSGIFILLAGVLGFGQWRIVALLSVFALTYTILLLYRGLTTVSRVRDTAAAVCVPLVLMLSAYLTQIMFSRLM
jgi:hypothetical protein